MSRRRLLLSLILPTLLAMLLSAGFYIYVQSPYFENLYYSEQTSNLYEMLEELSNVYFKNGGMLSEEDIDKFEDSTNAAVVLLDLDGNIEMTSNKFSKVDSQVYEEIQDYVERYRTNTRMYESVVIGKEQAEIYVKEVIMGTESSIIAKPILNYETQDTEKVLFCIAPLPVISITVNFIRDNMGLYFTLSLIVVLAISIVIYRKIARDVASVSEKVQENWELIGSQLPYKSGGVTNFRKQTEELISCLASENVILKKTLEETENSQREKAIFTGRVSHELKTPIALIRGYAEALRDRVRNDTRREYYENVIIEESLRMESLLEDLLDLSRLESGSYILSLTPFSIKELIIKSLNAFQTEIIRKNVVTKLKNLEHDIIVYADKNRIHQVIRNLLTNALKAIPENGELIVHVKKTFDNNVMIEIENSGEGIPQEYISQIWEQFYSRNTQNNSSKYETGGIGLGLSIVRSILLLHNSQFGVRNTKIGVCFYFTLNATEDENIM